MEKTAAEMAGVHEAEQRLAGKTARLCDSDVQPLLDGSADLPLLSPRVEGSVPQRPRIDLRREPVKGIE